MVLRTMYLQYCAVHPINRAQMKQTLMLLKRRDGDSAGHHNILYERVKRTHASMSTSHSPISTTLNSCYNLV